MKVQKQRHSIVDIDIPFLDIYVPKTPLIEKHENNSSSGEVSFSNRDSSISQQK